MQFQELERQRQINRYLSQEKFSERILAIQECMNAQDKYIELFYGFIGKHNLTQHSDAETPIISALIKNEIAIYSSLILTIDGLYGSGLVLLRSVYEALMIAKFSFLRQRDNLISKWIAGETIYLSKTILKKILVPDITELKALWENLCKPSHATIYSYQITMKFEEIENEISVNLAIISMLLCCNFHLINKHYVTNSMIDLVKRYHSQEGEFQSRRDSAKTATQSLTKFLSQSGRQVIKEYSRVWKLAPPVSS